MISRLKRTMLSAFMAVAVLLMFGTFAYAEKLDAVQKAIRDQGKHWVAGETENSRVAAYAPEYAKGRRIGLIKQKLTGTEPVLSPSTSTTALPTAFDWSTGGSFYNGKNYITPVRNQGNCGSCWAFATTAALESYTLIQGGDSTCILGSCDLSEEMLLTCGGGTCSGGLIDSASSYIRDTGLPTESCYSYNPAATACAPPSYWTNQAHKIVSWAYVATYSPTVEAIKNALVSMGPLVTTMEVYQDFYLYYRSGVYSYTSGSYVGSHAIAIVGYQDDSTFPGGGYFRVKNSWGSSWGEAGFFRVSYSELSSVVHFGNYTIAYLSAASPGALPAPTDLVAQAASSTQINLSWTDTTSNESGFKIERCAGAGCTSFGQIATVAANVTTYANTGLQANTVYNYRVRAYNSSGNSSPSNTANGTTLAPSSTPPAAPTGLSAAAVARDKINLKWTDSATNEDGFAVERCSGTGCTKFSAVAYLGANTTAYGDASLKRGTAYTYRVRAYNTAGNSAYSNTTSATTLR